MPSLSGIFWYWPRAAALLVSAFLALTWATFCAAEDDLFRERVAPVLQRRCLGCHNEHDRKGGYSLQKATSAIAAGIVVPGDPAASELLELVTPIDGQAEMPQNGEPLAADEVEALRRWIEQGAEWPAGFELQEQAAGDFNWWSLRPLDRGEVPAVDSPWVRTPIDAFVLARLQAHGLKPSAPADRRTLIRRLSFDLLGLPPSPAETEAFIHSPDPQAYEKLVDRFLASPHYGERWARHWLDVVKYADTHGYDKDKMRSHAWPYRDYVIRALNDDLPYDKFIQQQIAGDVLYPEDPNGKVALGFIAAGPWDFIGHVEVSESKLDGQVARNLDRDDMVSNTLNTFCSVTIQCARCHHHKFDPITQQHYYGLQAVFAAVDRANRPYDKDPALAKRRAALAERELQLQQQLAEWDQAIATAGGEPLAELERLIAKRRQGPADKPEEFGFHSQLATQANTQKWIELELAEPTDLRHVRIHPCHDDFNGIGAGFGFPLRYRIEAAVAARKVAGGQIADEGNNVEDAANGAEPVEWIEIADRTASDQPNPGLTTVGFDCKIDGVQRVRFIATRLAERKQDYMLAVAEVQLFAADPAAGAADPTPLPIARIASTDTIEAPPRWSRENLIDGKWPASAAAGQPTLAMLQQQKSELLSSVAAPQLTQREQTRRSLDELREQIRQLPEPDWVYAATTHFSPEGQFRPTGGRPRIIHVLARGEVNQPRQQVGPGVLPLAADDPWQLPDGNEMSDGQRRAALARWLTDPEHPLVWRSIVNRVWQYHFGQGLVATPNDFGRMGAQPTHPDLLDWLACEFRDRGKSLKALHRLIVTSNVYRQSSADNPEFSQIDASNQWLWRMNRRRLEAEEIRDAILQVSGSLDRQMGGPGFYLFELEKSEHSPHYEYHKFDPANAEAMRRSIYRFVVRSQPDPWMSVLDCADSSQSTAKRNETLTPLQALTLLNSRFNLVLAENFAARLQTDADGLDQQIELAVQRCFQRPLSVEERDVLTPYAREHGLPNLCRVLFNLNEFVFVD